MLKTFVKSANSNEEYDCDNADEGKVGLQQFDCTA